MWFGTFVITLTSLVVTTCSVLYRYELRGYSEEDKTCCNGTLAFATNMTHLPCSNMRCCDRAEMVAVVPVNYALGFGFRCLPRTKISTRCIHHGQTVVSSNETFVTYEPRVCCEGTKFNVLINKNDVALTIKCMMRR
ncbi:uncharacterized protein LOC110445294 [Mizuhopecten yessoensis]|uniref:uncharacterized protein LOC110445294 n=1 Tax=Mizuhopecten yessoensis TaxID=6573 RepID=UPI000B45761F|nr:uncharacterized protein LOC110445294 [Mizuhopecten yessoensis]